MFPRPVGTGTYDGRSYLVMSVAPGEPLRRGIEAAERRGAVYGDIEAMQILAGLLRALDRVHEVDLVHRDVKDANVLYEPASGTVTLIDFGFAKRTGTEETVTDDSFHRAGAPRFSPPGKLDHPARAQPEDDVFAAGVIGYRLLTGEYPWERANAGRTTRCERRCAAGSSYPCTTATPGCCGRCPK
jgi:serine/threonine-protein kinase